MGMQEVCALRDAVIDIKEGEMIALCGPSGSGKSTLLQILGLLDQPDSGEVFFRGQSMAQLQDAELAKIRSSKIGFIFQSYDLVDVLTAEENVSLPLINHGLSRKERKDRSREMLSAVGLEGYGDRYPMQMSGGQQQRVGIARALVTRPDIVFGDEITANLDSKTSDDLMSFLHNGSWNKTAFVFSTHDQHILQYMGRTVWMKDGSFADHD
jgi:putative ABC transport system ATP-binding protein